MRILICDDFFPPLPGCRGSVWERVGPMKSWSRPALPFLPLCWECCDNARALRKRLGKRRCSVICQNRFTKPMYRYLPWEWGAEIVDL
jgi:hypothetical protein